MRINLSLAVAGVVLVAGLLTMPVRADGLLTTHRLSAALANEAVGVAVATCAQSGYRVTSVILDPSGVQQALVRGDGAGIHTLQTANDKAFTAITYRTDTGVLVERAKTTPPSPIILKIPHLLLAQGAVAIKVGEEFIGAIGVSGAPGGEKDEACARAALDKIADRMK
jgi:uncharacterized protein GlcG (DUF336 family)